MADEMTDIKPRDLEILETLNEGKYSTIFKVHVCGRIAVMKLVSKPDHYTSRFSLSLYSTSVDSSANNSVAP